MLYEVITGMPCPYGFTGNERFPLLLVVLDFLELGLHHILLTGGLGVAALGGFAGGLGLGVHHLGQLVGGSYNFV